MGRPTSATPEEIIAEKGKLKAENAKLKQQVMEFQARGDNALREEV